MYGVWVKGGAGLGGVGGSLMSHANGTPLGYPLDLGVDEGSWLLMPRKVGLF